MAEEAKKKESKFYIMIPRVGGQIPRGGIIISQDRAVIENGVTVKGESTDIITPDPFGLIVVAADHPNYDRRIKALEKKMERENVEGLPPVLIGPFATKDQAFKKMHEVRPKTDSEEANESKQRAKTLEQENEDLKKRIAELQAKGGGNK